MSSESIKLLAISAISEGFDNYVMSWIVALRLTKFFYYEQPGDFLMPGKPTYEDLKHRVEELEKAAFMQRQASEALQDSIKTYRDLVETVHDMIWEMGTDGKFTYVSPRVRDIFGYEPEEMLGRSFFDTMPDDEVERVSDFFSTQAVYPSPSFLFESTHIHKEGHHIVFETSGKPFFKPDGTLIGFRGVNRDITERKETERALKESEEKYRNLVELSPDPIVILQDGVHKLINPAFTELFGYDTQDMKYLAFLDLVPENFKETALQRYKDRLSGLDISKSFVIDLIAKDGRRITCEASATMIQYNGRPADLATMRDITERRKAEEALIESEERLALVMEATRDGIWDWDIMNNKGYFSPRCAEITGIALPELTLDTWISRIHPDDQNSFSEKLKHQLKEYEPFNLEYRLKLENGEYRWQSSHGIVILDEDKKPKRMVGSIRDISETKYAEEALRKSENRLRQLSDATWEAIAIHDQGVLLHANTQYYEMFGYDPEELLGRHALLETVTPESADFILRHIDLDSSEAYETTGRKKDGMEFPIEIRGKLMDYYGRTVRVAAIRDLTERKKTEAALRESEERYRLLFENTGVDIYVFDREGICLMANRTAASQFDGVPEDFIGKTFHDFPLENADKYLERIREIVKSGEGRVFEEIVKLPSGKELWLLSNAQPVRDEKGRVFAVQTITQDITESKKAEEQIHTLTQQLITAQENERQRISRELHDRVAQDLSTSRIACELILDNQSIDEGVRQSVSEISNALHSTITAVRDLSYDLRPPGLAELGLIRTVFQYCKDFAKKTGVHVDFQSAGMDNLSLSFDTEINLYRVIQEGFNNIRKHADADNVIIRIISSFPNIILRMEDNGRGFDVEKRLIASMDEKRMGLRSMEERIRLLQGKINIHSLPGGGTKISVEVPFNGKKKKKGYKHLGRR